MKASELLVNALVNEGVNYVFGIPGEENLDFLDALSRSPIKLVLTRHEQAAGFMAATYGRLTGKAGVCLSTLGPGATNLVTAAAYANLGAMPMVMLTGQKPIKTSKQGQFQIVDVIDMMQPLTKFSRRIDSGTGYRRVFARPSEGPRKSGPGHLTWNCLKTLPGNHPGAGNRSELHPSARGRGEGHRASGCLDRQRQPSVAADRGRRQPQATLPHVAGIHRSNRYSFRDDTDGKRRYQRRQ
jgi:hypothetical protein